MYVSTSPISKSLTPETLSSDSAPKGYTNTQIPSAAESNTNIQKFTRQHNRRTKSSLKQRFLNEKALQIKADIDSQLKTELLAIQRELNDLAIERSRLAEYLQRGCSRVAGLVEEMWEIEMFERKDAVLTKEYYKKSERLRMWQKEMEGVRKSTQGNTRELQGENVPRRHQEK